MKILVLVSKPIEESKHGCSYNRPANMLFSNYNARYRIFFSK